MQTSIDNNAGERSLAPFELASAPPLTAPALLSGDGFMNSEIQTIIVHLARVKPQIFKGSYDRWYVRYGEKTPEDNCPSFHTEEQARKWAAWSEPDAG